MSSDMEDVIRKRIDDTFGIENLPKLAAGITALEVEGNSVSNVSAYGTD